MPSTPEAPVRPPRHSRLAWLGAVAGAVVVLAGSSLAVGYFVLTSTLTGRRWLRDAATRQVSAALGGRGRLAIGALGVNWRGDLWATQVALEDTTGATVVSVDSLHGQLRLRPLRDRVIHLTRAQLTGVTATLRQDAVGRPWNLAYLLAGDTARRPAGPPGFGDLIRLDTLALTDVALTTRMPWAPHPVFRGAARDSVVAVRDSLHDLRRSEDGRWFEHRAIRLSRVVAHAVTLVEPTGRRAGLVLDSLAGGLSDPGLLVTHARGRLGWTADALQLALEEVRLPRSRGSATGWVAWDQPGPVRFDVRVEAAAGLADLGWVWDVMPFEGEGRARVRMRTLEDPFDAEYRLEGLQLAVGPSRLHGQVAVVVRPVALELRAVDLTATRFEDALARRLSYGALPVAVRGTFDGRLRASAGGPLTAFPIEALDLRFRDRSGARADLRLSGVVSLGAVPGVRDMTLDTLVVDVGALRPLLEPTGRLAAVDGILSGRAHVAAADLAHLSLPRGQFTWVDGAGHVTRLGVSGTVDRLGEAHPAIAATLAVQPLDLRALVRLDSTVPLAGRLHGTVALRGTPDSLHWTAAVGAEPFAFAGTDERAGRMRGGVADTVPSQVATEGLVRRVGDRWQVQADTRLAALDLRAWRGLPALPTTAVDGSVEVDLALDSLMDPRGSVAFALQQVAGETRPGLALTGQMRLDSTRVRVDSVRVATGGIAVAIEGAVARAAGGADTLAVSARVEQPEQLRPELHRWAATWQAVDTATAARLARLAADSLTGTGALTGYLTGRLDSLDLTASLIGRGIHVGAVAVDRVFGSLIATALGTRPTVQGTASVDGVSGIGATAIRSATVRLADATADHGRFGVELRGASDLALDVRGAYDRPADTTRLRADTVQLRYAETVWRADDALQVRYDPRGWIVPAFALRSSRGGLLAIEAAVPTDGQVSGRLELQRFPLGEVGALFTEAPPVQGTVSGIGSLEGTREAPRLAWTGTADSLRLGGIRLPSLRARGGYAERVASAQILMRDSTGGAFTLEASLPMDLRLAAVPRRLLDDRIRGELRADSLRLEGLDWAVADVRDLGGTVTGRLAVSGTVNRPVAEGTLRVDDGRAVLDALGIAPRHAALVVRAHEDSLVLESLRIESGGPRDTLGVSGVLHVHEGEPAEVRLDVGARNFQLARRTDGTDVDVAGRLRLDGPLGRPRLSGLVSIPRATLAIDPLATRTALDLTSDMARALLGAGELPVAQSGAAGMAALGRFVRVDSLRVELANEVWVQTPEARVKLAGGLDVATAGDRLTLAGEIQADRGQYRLDLGVVSRSFSVDSGRVRFFAEPTLPTTLDIRATNVVRDAGGTEIPIGVHIGGSYEKPVLTLSSRDPLYASAPESEIISLLLFGAPTFALDGQRQSTVQAVTGVLLPSVGGAVEGALQRLLPVFNTVQVTTAGRQGTADLTAFSLLDNLSISAGKQLGERTYLRLNTGVCRGAGQASIRGASLWYGVAAEHRLAPHLMAQIGVDPGAAPCARLGADVLPRLQFGFDLFREWIW